MSRDPVAIAAERAWLGADLEQVTDAVVVVSGRTIAAAGPKGEVPVPTGARLDERRGTLLPGFIDAHVHIGFYPPADVVARGVTTVRDLGWPARLIAPLVRDSAADDFDGPTIVAAGQMLTAPGGYPTRAAWAPAGTGLEVDGPDAAARAVGDVAEAGAVVVKVALNPPVGPVLDAATLGAIVTAAHDRGLRVTAHVHGLDELDKALDAGVDELAHMLLSDERVPSSAIARMVEQEMVVVPTLAVFDGTARDTAIQNLMDLLRAGGRVVYGTDLGNVGPEPGIDAREIAGMSAAGMAAHDIVASATVEAASYLGLEGTGSIEGGKDADLVLVDGDPIADPGVLTRATAVWRRGRFRSAPD